MTSPFLQFLLLLLTTSKLYFCRSNVLLNQIAALVSPNNPLHWTPDKIRSLILRPTTFLLVLRLLGRTRGRPLFPLSLWWGRQGPEVFLVGCSEPEVMLLQRRCDQLSSRQQRRAPRKTYTFASFPWNSMKNRIQVGEYPRR